MSERPRMDVLRPQSPEDLAGIGALLESAFGPGPAWGEQVAWQYLDNPLGRPWMANARREDGELLAHVAFMPLPPLDHPELGQHPVFFSLNTAVRRDAGVPGLFPVLGRKLLQTMARDLGTFTVLGVANENSTEGFVRLLGFRNLGPLQLRVFPPWARPAATRPRAMTLTPEVLAWRMARPGCSYRLHGGSGQLLRRMSHHGIPIDAVLSADDLGRPAASGPALPALRLYAVSGRGEAGGIPVPDRFRPSPLNQIARTFPAGNMDLLEGWLQNARFEFVDFDVV